MEWMDIYDAAGNKTGRQAERHTALKDGEFFLCAHIILENTAQQFLIQQRSDSKESRPGQWDITAGAVDVGETSLIGALQEAKEEVGLTVPSRAVRFLFRDQRPHCFHDIYYACFPFSLKECTMQASEVQALRLVSNQELIALMQQQCHRTSFYKTQLTNFLENRTKFVTSCLQ